MCRIPAGSLKYAILQFIIAGLLLTGCSSPLIETHPANIRDTGVIKITCDATKGNMGLMHYDGPVYVHLGLITDSSIGPAYWRYVKFKWGSAEEAALAKPAGKNKWTYEIPDIRKFFGVHDNENILKLALLFRAGNCVDTLCKTLRNEDGSDIFIPVNLQN
jgi:hypothetical protein